MENIKIVIRTRPLTKDETESNYETCIDVEKDLNRIKVINPKRKSDERIFCFDRVYSQDDSQGLIYDSLVKNLVDLSIKGYNSTIIAYGQTGTGKTYTIIGDEHRDETIGIIPRAFKQLFQRTDEQKNMSYLIRVSYLEIYKEQIYDLLNRDNSENIDVCEYADGSVYYKNLSSVTAMSLEDISRLFHLGNKQRSTAQTKMNDRSSRSHAIFMIIIESFDEIDSNNAQNLRIGKLNFVDLAGSERQSKSGSSKARVDEAIKINHGLMSLGRVITSITSEKSKFVPYRDSKLTMAIKDSIGGNSKTVIIGNVGPAAYNYDETINTLRYMTDAKEIRNKPIVNFNPKDGLLKNYLDEIARLRQELMLKQTDNQFKDYTLLEADLSGQKEEIMANKNILLEEKTKMLILQQTKEDKLLKEKEETLEMQKRLNQMENKLVYGGGKKKILQQLKDGDIVLERNREEIEKHKLVENEIREKMSNEVSRVGKLQKNVSSLSGEVSLTTKRLKKLIEKFQSLNKSYENTEEYFHKERREAEMELNELQKDVKLKNLMIENFIPDYEFAKLHSRLYIDSDSKKWRLNSTLLTARENSEDVYPWNLKKAMTSTCLYAKNTKRDENNRYKMRNILNLDLIEPISTVHETLSTPISPEHKKIVENAFAEENAVFTIDVKQIE